jgi:hypothetical protein
MEAMNFNSGTGEWHATQTTEAAILEDRKAGRDKRQLLTMEEYQSLQRAARHFRRPATPELAALACQRNQLSQQH